jgi:hypothetical protein
MTETETNDRVPCPNEMCVGVMGDDGVCGTCGVGIEHAIEHREHTVAEVANEALQERVSAATDAPEEGALVRVPCADDMCVGIYENGVCGTCGRNELV